MNPPVIRSRISPHSEVLLLLAALLTLSSPARTQPSDRISGVTAKPVQQGQPLVVQAVLNNAAVIERAELAYRQFGQRDYKKLEMMIAGNSAAATVPGSEIVPPFIEYYVLAYSHDSTDYATYPLFNPESQPLRVEVLDANTMSDFVAVISPEENEQLQGDDVLISFIVGPDTIADPASTHVSVDEKDVSSLLVRSGNLIILRPENANLQLSGGSHTIAVQVYGKDGKELGRSAWSFGILGGMHSLAGTTGGWLYSSSLQLETRSENIGGASTPYNRATLAAGGMTGDYHVNGRVYITNEEKEGRQPQHRFFLGAESPWLKLGVGDAYPTFPDLIMSGKRVRGFTGNLSLGGFGLDVTTGQVLRHVEGDTLKTFARDSLNAEQSADPSGSYASYDMSTTPQLWAKIRGGTFARDLYAIRSRFGKKESSHLGFTFLKSKDDVSSIRYGVKPQENLVLGSDFVLTFGHRTVEVTGQAAASATNKDIARGTFTDAEVDSTFQTYSESSRNNIRRVRDILSHFITVNENLIPLAAKNLPTLAYEGSFALTAFDNAFKFTYLRHGNSFESFGESFVRPDVVGYNILDRLRLVQNILFLSGGFERLQDNTAETKLATTTSTTANLGISYFPRTGFPNVTVGYAHALNANDYPIDSLRTDDRTNRVLVQLSRPFTHLGRHQATLSASTSMRDDRTPRNFDVHSTNVSLAATSVFDIPLQTSMSVSINWNSFFTVDPATHALEVSRDYTVVYLHSEYRFGDDRVRISGTLSPMLGDADLRRTLIGGGAQYFFSRKVSGLTDLNLYLNGSRDNDIIWSLILRVDV